MSYETIRISGTPSIMDSYDARQEECKRAVDWDAIERQAKFAPKPKRITTICNTKSLRLPPLPPHLSTLHLKAFVEFRVQELGFTFEELKTGRGHLVGEVKRQLVFEAFVLGFPVDYIYNVFEEGYHIVSYAAKDYCGSIGIQKVRERYGISVYRRAILRVELPQSIVCRAGEEGGCGDTRDDIRTPRGAEETPASQAHIPVVSERLCQEHQRG